MTRTRLLRVTRALGAIAWCLAATAFVWLGLRWATDRLRVPETPRWQAARFRVVREGPRYAEARETWVVAIQPACPHCAVHLAERIAERARTGAQVRIEALVVDVDQPPSATVLADADPDAVWWDADHVWRRRWRHGLYGEVMLFDRRGVLRRTVPPGKPIRAANVPARSLRPPQSGGRS